MVIQMVRIWTHSFLPFYCSSQITLKVMVSEPYFMPTILRCTDTWIYSPTIGLLLTKWSCQLDPSAYSKSSSIEHPLLLFRPIPVSLLLYHWCTVQAIIWTLTSRRIHSSHKRFSRLNVQHLLYEMRRLAAASDLQQLVVQLIYSSGWWQSSTTTVSCSVKKLRLEASSYSTSWGSRSFPKAEALAATTHQLQALA